MDKQDFSLISTLKETFPEDSWSWAIPALKREPLVWETLRGEHFQDKARKEIGPQPQKWTPAHLGATAVNLDLPFNLPWPLPPFNELDPEIRQRVYQKYQDFTEETQQVTLLMDALLLALGLKQEKDAGKTWQELLHNRPSMSAWRGPLVCLYEMLDSPATLLRVVPDHLGIHIVLSTPSSPAAAMERLQGHLSSFDRPKQLAWLDILKEESPDITSRMAKTLASHSNPQPSSIAEIVADSEIYRTADDPHTALQMLMQASSLHEDLKVKLLAKINAAHAQVEAPQLSSQFWQDLLDTVEDPDRLASHADVISDLLGILIEKKFFAAAENLVEHISEPLPEHPRLLTHLAAYALSQDEPQHAQRLALQALHTQSEHSPSTLSKLLFDLGLFEEAIQAATSTLSAYPTHKKTLSTLAKAQDKVGDHARAVDHAQLAVLTRPEDIDLKRQFASYLEHDGEWEAALRERSDILAKLQGDLDNKSTFKPLLPVDDLHALARCAYRAEQPSRAVKVCENILKQNPDDGLAHATLGKALRDLGKDEEGFTHLEKATDKAPELADAWLALADSQSERGEEKQALKTLKMGASAAEKKAKIHLAIGKLHQDRGAQSEALEAFQTSSRLAKEESIDGQTDHEIGFQLGNSYYRLGHLKEARKTLRELKERYPGNHKTHYLYGQVLLEMGEPRGALPYLAQVVDTEPEEVGPYIDYADAHLQIDANPKIAIKTLDQALQMEPENEKAQALLAEAYAANEEYDLALSQFKEALDSQLSQDPAWGPRITMGFGTTALNLGHTETALATLQDGFHEYPHHLTLAQALAEAFSKADLKNDALATAREVLDIAPDDMDNLEWVSDFALGLDSPQDAIPALQEMIHLQPERPSTYIQLGKAHRQNGDPEKARDVFSKISGLDHATPSGLYQAGDALLDMGDIEPAMNCLEKAAHISQANAQSDPILPEIWARLADGLTMNGQPEEALDLLDQAIAEDLDQPQYRVKKADLLIDQERYQAALASLKNALDLNPRDPSLHYKIARLYQKLADFSAALNHAQRAVEIAGAPHGEATRIFINATALAGDLAAATAQPELAYQILKEAKPDLLKQISSEESQAPQALSLLGELALMRGEEIEAASLLNKLLEKDAGNSFRISALQARVLARQGKLTQAHDVLDEIVAERESDATPTGAGRTTTLLGIARAFQDLERWREALIFYRKAAQDSPRELRSQLALTRALVRRAEKSRFAQSLKALHHTPGTMALAQEAKREFNQTLLALKERTTDTQLIRRWELRGAAVFQKARHPLDALEDFAHTPEDLGALLAALRHQRQMDRAAKRAIGKYENIGESKYFDSQVALSILKINPEKALEAAASALELSDQSFDLTTPLYHILNARAQAENQQTQAAHGSVLKALERWEDEPRWHALAAQYCPSPPEAISHLERAVELEPEYAGHHLALGQALLRNNEPMPAIKALEETVNLMPEVVEGWIALARCYRKVGSYSQAMECAQKAVEYAPEDAGARIMVAEIALAKEEYPLAERNLEALAQRNPQDPQVLGLLSRTLAAQNRPEEALQVIEKAIRLSEDPLDLKLQQAELIQQVDGTQAAVDALRVLGSHYPDNYRVVSALVNALAEGGETDQAVSTAKTILSKDDVGHTPEQKARLHRLTGRLLRKAGQLDQAIHHLNEAKKLDPDAYDTYLELGRTHIDRRQYDRALERLNEAIEMAPDKAMAYFYAGKVLKELKHYDRAERMLRQASKLAPNDLRVHRQLGVLATLNLVHGNNKKKEAIR